MQRFRSLATSTVAPMVRRAMATYKTSTGLVGLSVDPNGRETLFNLSQDIMEAVKVTFCVIIHIKETIKFLSVLI